MEKSRFTLPYIQRIRLFKRLIRRVENRILKSLRSHLIANYIEDSITKEIRHFNTIRQFEATSESLRYAERHMAGAAVFSDKQSVRKYAMEHVKLSGLYLEFGVWRGSSINFIADHTTAIVHGFDSFGGLPEDWMGHYKRSKFDTKGHLPVVKENVLLHVGWFDEVLPSFVQKYRDDIAFLHVDCDLYSSTKTIFQYLGDRIKQGCVIVFDEYFNYPGWQDHEYKAFQELVHSKGLKYRYLCYNDSEFNVAVIIE